MMTLEHITLPSETPLNGHIITSRPFEKDDYPDFVQCKKEAGSFDPDLDSYEQVCRLTNEHPDTILMADVYDGVVNTKNTGTIKGVVRGEWPLIGGLAVKTAHRNGKRIGTSLEYDMCDRFFRKGFSSVELLTDLKNTPEYFPETMTGTFHESNFGFKNSYIAVGMEKRNPLNPDLDDSGDKKLKRLLSPYSLTAHDPYKRHIAAFMYMYHQIKLGGRYLWLDTASLDRAMSQEADVRIARSIFNELDDPHHLTPITMGRPHATTLIPGHGLYESCWSRINQYRRGPQTNRKRGIPLPILGLFTLAQPSEHELSSSAGYYVAYDTEKEHLIPFRAEDTPLYGTRDKSSTTLEFLDPELDQGRHILDELVVAATALSERIASTINLPARYYWDPTTKKLFAVDCAPGTSVQYLFGG